MVVTVHEPAALKRGMLDSLNALRVAFKRDPLNQLPAGKPGNAQDCSGHRALRDLGLGDFSVATSQLVVDQRFAELVEATWGTMVVPCSCRNTDGFLVKCNQTHVTLPNPVQRFIHSFDARELPELIAT